MIGQGIWRPPLERWLPTVGSFGDGCIGGDVQSVGNRCAQDDGAILDGRRTVGVWAGQDTSTPDSNPPRRQQFSSGRTESS